MISLPDSLFCHPLAQQPEQAAEMTGRVDCRHTGSFIINATGIELESHAPRFSSVKQRA